MPKVIQSIPLPVEGLRSNTNPADLLPGQASILDNLIVRQKGSAAFLEIRQPWQSFPNKTIEVFSKSNLVGSLLTLKRDGNIYESKATYNILLGAFSERFDLLSFKTIPIFSQGSDEADFLIVSFDLNHFKDKDRVGNNVQYRFQLNKIKTGVDDSGNGTKLVGTVQSSRDYPVTKENFLHSLESQSIFFRQNYIMGLYLVDNKVFDANDASLEDITTWKEATKEDANDIIAKTYRFTLYEERILVCYGDEPHFHYYDKTDETNKLVFKKHDIRTTTGGIVIDESIYTIFMHVVQETRDSSTTQALYVITTKNTLIAYRYLPDPTNQGAFAWTEISSRLLPGTMVGKDAWCLNANGDIFIVLSNGIYTLGITGYRKEVNFHDTHLLAACDGAKISFSRHHRMYFLELFFITEDLDIDSVVYMADQDVASWSRMTLGKLDYDLDVKLGLQRGKLEKDPEPPLFIDASIKPISLPGKGETDVFGLRFKQQIFYTHSLLHDLPVQKDFFFSWDAETKAIPRYQYENIGYGVALPQLKSGEKIRVFEGRVKLSSSVGIMNSEIYDENNPHPAKSTITLNAPTSLGTTALPNTDLTKDVALAPTDYSPTYRFTGKINMQNKHAVLKGEADANLALYGVDLVVNVERER